MAETVTESPPWEEFQTTAEDAPWKDFESSEVEEPTSRELIGESRRAQLEAARRESRPAEIAFSALSGAESAADVIRRTRPDLVARQALGLASQAVRPLIEAIPGIPPRPPEAPDLTQQPVVSPEQAQQAVEFLDPFGRAAEGSVHKGVQQAAAEVLSSLTDPATAFSMGPVARVPELARPLFAIPMVAGIPEATERLRQEEGTPEQIAAALSLAGQVALPAVIERGLRTPPRLPLTQKEVGVEPRAIPFPPQATEGDVVASKRRAQYVAEQKAALEPEPEQPTPPATEALGIKAPDTAVPTSAGIPADEIQRASPTLEDLQISGGPKDEFVKYSLSKPNGTIIQVNDKERWVLEDRTTANGTRQQIWLLHEKVDGKWEPVNAGQVIINQKPDGKITVSGDHGQLLRDTYTDSNGVRHSEPTIEAEPIPTAAPQVQPAGEVETKFKSGDAVDYYSPVVGRRFKGVVTGVDEQRGFVHIVNEDGAPVVQKVGDVQLDQTQKATSTEPTLLDKPASWWTAKNLATLTPERRQQIANSLSVKSTTPATLAKRAQERLAAKQPTKGTTSEKEKGQEETRVLTPLSAKEQLQVGDVITENPDGSGMKVRVDAVDPKGLDTVLTEIQTGGKSNPYSPSEKRLRQESFENNRWFVQPPAAETPSTPPAATAKSGPWYEQHGEEAKQSIFAAMREVQSRVDAAGERERALRAPAGSIAAGGGGFDEFIRSESQAEVLRAIRKGATPEQAEASAKQYAREAIEKHNAKRPKDVNWKRWEGTADSYIERAVSDIRDAAKPAQPTPGAQPEGPSVGPGAASPEDVGATKSDMQALSESMEKVASPAKSMQQRVAEAKKAVGQLKTELPKTIGEKVRNGVERLSALGSALKTGLTKLPEFTNFKRILGEWDGSNQQADFELRQFVKTINRNIPAERQVAITNWIQAGGDSAILRERANASKTGKLRKGYEDALTLSKDEIVAARNIESYLESRLQAGIDSGILDHGLDNYVTQIWKKPNPATQKLVSDISIGRLQPNFRYARQRLLESYFEGEQLGFTPANKQVSALIAAYDQSFNRAIAARGFIKNLTEGTASDGRPLVEVSGSGRLVPADESHSEAILIKPKTKSDAIADYRSIDHPALRKWKWVGQSPEGTPVLMEGQLLVHPEIYQHLKNILGRSIWRQHVVPRTILGIERGIKELMFSASGFHQVQETLHSLGHRVNPANLEKVDFSQPWQREAVNHGLQVASYDAMENFSEGLSSGSLVKRIPVIGKRILGPYTEWLFQDWIPRLKVTMYKHALERNLERYAGDLQSGKITRNQLVENTAKQANAAFGELNYNWIGRNKSVQDSLRAFLIAPDFLEARAKFVGQAAKGYGREQLVALGLLAATQYITARILNQIYDDDPHWELKNAFKFIVKKHSYELRSIPGDIVHLVSDPKKFSVARISPFMRSAIEGITGRDYRGVKRDALEQIKDFAKLPTPISARRQDDQRWWETFLNAFGVHERQYTAGQEVAELAKQYREKVKGKATTEIIESEDSPYRKVRLALDLGNEKTGKQALEELRKTHTDAQIFQTMQRARRHPFTGMKASDEAKFRRTLEPVQEERYKEALKERDERYQKFLKLWQQRGPK